jgi:hypothetical protein
VQVNLRYSLDLRPYQKLLIPLYIALVNQPGPCPSNYEEGQELSLLSTSQKYGFFFVTQAKRNTKTTYVASASPAYERIAHYLAARPSEMGKKHDARTKTTRNWCQSNMETSGRSKQAR